MLEINFTPFPNLITERLILRQLNAEDAKEVFAIRSDDRVNKFIDRPKARSIDDALEFIHKINNGIVNNESIYWVITLKNSNKLIGTICFWNISKENYKAETGYELHPDFQGKGIMQEALSKVIEYGFHTLKLQTIEAYTHAENESSIKLLEKNNFRRVTHHEDKYQDKQEMSNEVIYSLNTGANTDKRYV